MSGYYVHVNVTSVIYSVYNEMAPRFLRFTYMWIKKDGGGLDFRAAWTDLPSLSLQHVDDFRRRIHLTRCIDMILSCE